MRTHINAVDCMTRKKKSRKPGVGSIGIVKDTKAEFSPKDKKPKKRIGNKAGTKQQVAQPKQKGNTQSSRAKDPRIGSKKPIALTVESQTSAPVKPAVKTEKSGAIAKVRVVEQADTSLQQQLAAIESNAELLAIVAKQDENLPLTEAEVDLYNKLMAEHESLSEQLDAQHESQDIDESTKSMFGDDDDMWDKLDNYDFSDHK